MTGVGGMGRPPVSDAVRLGAVPVALSWFAGLCGAFGVSGNAVASPDASRHINPVGVGFTSAVCHVTAVATRNTSGTVQLLCGPGQGQDTPPAPNTQRASTSQQARRCNGDGLHCPPAHTRTKGGGGTPAFVLSHAGQLVGHEGCTALHQPSITFAQAHRAACATHT